MNSINIGNDLYLKGRIGWRGLSKNEYLNMSDYRIINATSLEDKFINWDICGYITKERYEESPEIQLKEKDILISKDGTLGKIGYVRNLTQPSTVASGVFVLRNTKDTIIDTDYLYHFLKSNYFKLFISRMKAEGSTINHLYQRDLSQLTLEVPSLNKQKRVAAILSSLDSKIELNNKINSELEKLIKTLYEYWFVQFDFPNESGKPFKSNGGKMQYNAELKREIPENWEVGTIHKYANLLGGGTPRTENDSYWNGSIPFFTPKDSENSIFVTSTKLSITESGLKNCSSRLYPKGTVFVTARGTVGNVNVASQNMAMNQSCYALQPRENISYSFVHQAVCDIVHQLKVKAAGSVFDAIVSNDFNYVKIPIAPVELIQQFSDIIDKNYEMILNNKIQNMQLTNLRDWLLPMLMNGQVKVSDLDTKINTGRFEVANAGAI